MGKTRNTGNLSAENILTTDIVNDKVTVGSGITLYGGSVGIVSASGGFNIGINSSGTTITSGPITSLNFVGTGNTFAVNGTTVDISISGGGGGLWEYTDVGIHTLSNVGVGTTNPTSALTVSGDAYFTGIVTAKRFETYWPTDVDYNFVAGFQAGQLIDSDSDFNVLIGFQAGYDLLSSDENIAIGDQALYGGVSNNGSTGNIAIGYRSLYTITSGDYNVAIGYAAGQSVTTASRNTFIGYFTGGTATSGTSAFDNIAIGYLSGYSLSTGLSNTFLGNYSGYSITTGDYNVCIGHESGYNLDSNQIGNTLVGYEAGYNSDLGDYIVSLGFQAGYSQESDGGIFIGYQSGYNSLATIQSVVIGYQAGWDMEGDYNVAIGPQAMYDHDGGGDYNIAIGYQAKYQDGTSSSHNIAIGYQALYGETITTGNGNIAIGFQAGDEITTGQGNLLLGNFAGNDITSGSENVVIYAALIDSLSVPSVSESNQLIIGSGNTTWITGNNLYNIGIGTTNPSSKLSVIGDISASGIVTASGGFNLGISSAGTSITSGPITTLNFVGVGNTFAVDGTTVDISISGASPGISQSLAIAYAVAL